MGCFTRPCASVHSRRSVPTFQPAALLTLRPCSEAKKERVNSYVDDQIWGVRVSAQSPEHDHREFARTQKSGDDERGGLRPRRSACGAVRRRTTPLSNGLSLVRARPSTINPQGVRYASVRPLRLRLRGDRARARTRRRLSSGDGPCAKIGSSRCRTISTSPAP
jgi:hypothetical protein